MMNFLSFLPSITSQAPAVASSMAGESKKEGIAKMLSGLGKGTSADDSFGLRPLPQQQGIDVQSLLASLFGG